MSRQERLLHEMGLQRWQVRRPEVFHGASTIHLASNIKLLFIQSTPLINNRFFNDILITLNLSLDECYSITPEQLPLLHCSHSLIVWLVSNTITPHSIDFLSSERVKTYIHTPEWQQLQHNIEQKKTLWKTLQQLPQGEQ